MTNSASIQEITFVLREAPSRSKWAGHLMAEIRATDNSIKLLKAMRDLGLWHPTEECKINVMETYRSAIKGYKILRFTADAETYRLLHGLCSPATEEDIAKLTDAHMARLSIPAAIDELTNNHSRKDLVAMSKQLDAGWIRRNSRANKRMIAEFICAQVA